MANPQELVLGDFVLVWFRVLNGPTRILPRPHQISYLPNSASIESNILTVDEKTPTRISSSLSVDIVFNE
jgi:hypothetical protein